MEINKIYFENCFETLLKMDDNCVNLMIQDTPFGVTQNEWDVAPDFDKMWPEWLRVGKEHSAYIFFGTQPFVSDLINSNRKMFRYDLIWYKALGTGFLNAKKMPMRNHEHIVIFYKKLPIFNPQMGRGVRKMGKRNNTRTNSNYNKFKEDRSGRYDDNGIRYPQSVLDFSNGDRTTEQDHPTQKPIRLLRYLIKTYSNEGDLIFDGYMGSGTTAIACIEEKRNFIGSENNLKYFDLLQARISNLLKAPKLFE